MQQPCAGWAEEDLEEMGPVGKGGASWEEVGEAEAGEELSGGHASSVVSDHLKQGATLQTMRPT